MTDQPVETLTEEQPPVTPEVQEMAQAIMRWQHGSILASIEAGITEKLTEVLHAIQHSKNPAKTGQWAKGYAEALRDVAYSLRVAAKEQLAEPDGNEQPDANAPVRDQVPDEIEEGTDA